MKQLMSKILFIIMSVILIVSVLFCVYSIYGIYCTMEELANDSSASGVEYLGIGWGYNICLFATSTLGLILSIISRKLQQQRILQNISVVAIVIFSLLIVASIFLFLA